MRSQLKRIRLVLLSLGALKLLTSTVKSTITKQKTHGIIIQTLPRSKASKYFYMLCYIIYLILFLPRVTSEGAGKTPFWYAYIWCCNTLKRRRNINCGSILSANTVLKKGSMIHWVEIEQVCKQILSRITVI